jgi:hypothetical protein
LSNPDQWVKSAAGGANRQIQYYSKKGLRCGLGFYAAINLSIAISGRQLNRTGRIAHPKPFEINRRVFGVRMKPLE